MTDRQVILTEKINNLKKQLRAGQQRLADWESGSLAVSAVPGAGKSTGMAIAAAITIARHQLHSRHQLVLVTFTRSAAANLKSKVTQYLLELSLNRSSFMVATLHGLALQIATKHPELSGLNTQENPTLITPSQNHSLIRNAVNQWINNNPNTLALLIEGNQPFNGEETERIRRLYSLRTEVLPELAHIVIHEAKSSGLLPSDLYQISHQITDQYNILNIAAGLYQEYQNLLLDRNLIDYDQMILGAVKVLDNITARELWQKQIFAVFEDEAQDSTPLQTKLLEILASDDHRPDDPPNLVRVGDPNQAINSTFSPADPIYFRKFCNHCKELGQLAELKCAGRSTSIIITIANFVLNWVNEKFQKDKSEILPFEDQKIQPVPLNDPQPDANPEPTGQGVEISIPDDIYQTVELIADRAINLLTDHPERSAAILVRQNRQAKFLHTKLENKFREAKIALYDVTASDRHCRIPEELLMILKFMDRPHSSDYLKGALEILLERKLIQNQDLNALITFPENFLYPNPLDPIPNQGIQRAKKYCTSLLKAQIELPPYQLIPFIAFTLDYDPNDLATAEKINDRIQLQSLRQASLAHIINILTEIVNSENFEGLETDQNDQRYTLPGQLTIITMHKAKGLDWDYVFIPFLHEDILPGKPWIPVAAKFLGEFTLAEVARAQIRDNLHDNPIPTPDQAWKKAQSLKEAEEYRLFYVAITRAKRLLWLSAAKLGPFQWSGFNIQDGINKLQKKTAAIIFQELFKQLKQSSYR